jgi:hypothetical protein
MTKSRWVPIVEHTERVAVAYLGPPAAYQMHLVLRNGCHFWIPTSHKLSVLVDLVRLDLVEYYRVDVLAASQDLGEAALNILVQLAALGCAVDEGRQRPALLLAVLLLTGARIFCGR